MQDQPGNLSPGSSQIISISEYPAIKYWCESLGCSEVQLAEAIAHVGYSADRVRVYLETPSRGHSPPNSP
jgi:uncharacterized protein DUF3606